ncbi:hypothetical protein HYPSUDRAFT_197811 [Hypholoma sublateritium FD-334 SS-4]|uniref:Uncharacterized protein n=1 Tax=Hypholoma sublateritium (strain FD-334 SS-4) TaxID=945553 RepID=A0A0D2Q783_HYPSF|nr:hypothetical protein HYPSUDRAFT_197811 [Hypholoma sublateritium FD-334 SS-4]
MTHGPPSTAASSSKSPASSISNAAHTTPQIQQPDPAFPVWHNSQLLHYPTHPPGYGPALNQNYAVHATPVPMSYYPNIDANPYAAYLPQPQSYRWAPSSKAPPSTTYAKPPKPKMRQATPKTPPLPEQETYKHWDEAVKGFLVRAKFMQTLKGFESDMLVLNAGWEQEVIPGALAEMVKGLQTILDRVAGKQKADDTTMDTSPDVDILSIGTTSVDKSALDDRKLAHVAHETGVKLQSHSSINKSISQFLAQTRARNDASNRAEFLYSLSEKRRKLQEEGGNPDEALISSCARVDAKPVDRDKQMKFDIAKNGEGPLTKTVKQPAVDPPPVNTVQTLSSSAAVNPQQAEQGPSSRTLEKKRKIGDLGLEQGAAASKTKAKRKLKGKGKDLAGEVPDEVAQEGEETFEARFTADDMPSVSERLKNIEEHFALRYVPSIPRTLFARLKFLEDHIIKLEQEYPPWAALHFNQPIRGWPAPPRATPIIVPPHLRSSVPTAASQTSDAANSPSTSTVASAVATPSQTPPVTATGQAIKSRKANSSLHRAVLDRLEVQRAMDEMNGMRQGL